MKDFLKNLFRRRSRTDPLAGLEIEDPQFKTTSINPVQFATSRVCFSHWEGMDPALIEAQKRLGGAYGDTTIGPRATPLPTQKTPLDAVQMKNSAGGLYWRDRDGFTYWIPPANWNGELDGGKLQN